jgi:hypothetical protein
MSLLANLLCATLIATHAWERFNTPTTNRSSTQQTLYWSSFAGYLICALALFAALSTLLQIGPWRAMLLGKADAASLLAPLIATVALTTLLPSVPLLKQLDASLLAFFLNWGEIPAEVKRRAAAMTTQRFRLTESDVIALRETYSDGRYGETLADQLRWSGAEGIERNQLRFTRVVKLYDQITRLARARRYARFFAEAEEEYAELNRQIGDFLRRSVASLALTARLQAAVTGAIYEQLEQERRAAFAQACNEVFNRLALFLSRAVLRSEPTEEAIVNRLRSIGFEADPITLPAFPIDSLTALAVGVFFYFAGLGIFFSHLQDVPQQPGGWFAGAGKIALIRVGTAGMTVWLMQRYAFFRRAPGGPPRYFAYFVCGLIASAISLLILLPFHVSDDHFLGGIETDLAPVVLSGVLCVALAFCCDAWQSEAEPPVTRRLMEAAGCGMVMALAAAFVYFAGLLPYQLTGMMLGAWFVLPAIMAIVLGGFVPHIYRSARRAASARHVDVADLAIAQAPLHYSMPLGNRSPRPPMPVGPRRP